MINDSFLRACRREPTEFTPIWIMRQAGRYLPEYRALREKYSFIELCRTPAAALEVTLQPLERFPLDAAIIFADILLPLEGMGVDFGFDQDDGPCIGSPIRRPADVDRIRVIEAEAATPYLFEAIRQTRAALKDRVPLIGFAGAPFTLASYMIEGGHSRNYEHTKAMFYAEPGAWARLMEKLVEVLRRYLLAQVAAGAQAVQLFDSWVGCLSPRDYAEFVAPHVNALIAQLAEAQVPVIHFATDVTSLLPLIKDSGAAVYGVDWRIELDRAWQIIGHDRALQGNLDPAVLLAPPSIIESRARDVLQRAGGRPGHIFNLGHGIWPNAPIENVAFLVETVHRLSRRSA
jgi:uroporphyrinogen decarboxylase